MEDASHAKNANNFRRKMPHLPAQPSCPLLKKLKKDENGAQINQLQVDEYGCINTIYHIVMCVY
jgi:hypothetical protein